MRRLLVLCLLGVAPAAVAQPAVNGYVDSRLWAAHVRTGGLLPTADVPAWANLTELNMQLKLRWGDRGLALIDDSFFYQRAWAFPDGFHDVPAYRPLSVISEAYASYNVTDHLNLTAGKKRIVWGPGQALNPTDLLNPPKDPTDPTQQRAGSWLARVEVPYERFTVSLVGAARAFGIYGGVPSTLIVDPEAPDRSAHYAAAARVYALVADADLGLYYVFTNRYNDAFENKSRLGASFSRLVGKTVEVHGEALVQRGSVRPFKNLGNAMVTKMLLGPRYTFSDDSTLGLEYYFNGDGYTADEFETGVRLLSLMPSAAAPTSMPTATMDGRDQGVPQKFSFDPIRRHYLFVSALKPRIHDDFTVQATVILNLQDLTGQFAPLVSWSVREWVSLTLAAFAPLPGLASQQVAVAEHHYGEFSLTPLGWRVLAGVRLFY